MRDRVDGEFEKNVFINCPFDSEYYSLLRPLLFTIVYLGFNPKIALERSDSGEQRIDKICELIRKSKYSIHDLSRLKSRTKGEFYRLNIAFELGIDYGSRRFASNYLKGKKCLILEKGLFDYRRAISDFSGADIKNHNNQPEKVIRAVRNWFVETIGLEDVEGSAAIWYEFSDFASDFYRKRKEEGFSDEDLQTPTRRSVVENVPTVFPDSSSGTAGIGGRQGNLGADVLRRFKVIYDYSRKRMIIEPNKFFREPFGVVPNAATATKVSAAESRAYVGRYGERTISFEDGALFLQRRDGPKIKLVLVSRDEFTLELIPAARIKFVRDENGKVTELQLLNRAGEWEKSRREP